MQNTNSRLNIGVKDNIFRFKPFIADKKKNTYLTAILSLLTMSFFGVFAIKPTITTAVSLTRDIGDLQALNEQYEQKITTIIKGQSEYEKIRDDIPLINMTLPTTSEFTKQIIAEENIATRSNILIASLQIDPVPISKSKDTGNVESFSLTFSGDGDYKGAYDLVLNNLKQQRLVSIEQVSLEQAGASGSAQLKVSVKAKSYYEP